MNPVFEVNSIFNASEQHREFVATLVQFESEEPKSFTFIL